MIHVALRKTSLVDYPGKIAAALFLPGCNLRCPWCHNGDLVRSEGGSGESAEFPEDSESLVPLDDALRHIEKRRAVLGAVVLSGGEPTIHRELPELIRRIKSLELPVKLDTNGMVPEMLKALFAEAAFRPAYIALDLKLAPARYGELRRPASAGNSAGNSAAALKQSAALISASGIGHEYRSLALPGVVTPADIEELAPLVDDSPWYFRPFRPGNCLDAAWNNREAGGPRETEALARRARELGKRGVSMGVE
ncbi:MAG: radical SAM protein [Treponema sp.]|nr:radical SAM protein [Treponema sp.]